MKKRFLCILLISMMLLSMLPMTALADNSTLTEPVLQMRVRVWNNGEEGVQVVTEEYDYPIYHWLEAKFFLHYPNDTVKPLDITQLTFTSGLDCRGVNDEGWIEIQTADIGLGRVVYVEDSVTYTFNINVTYPDLGIYTAIPFDANSLTDIVTVDSVGCVFYIALSPELQAQGCVMTEIHSAFGSEVYHPSITTIGTVVLSDDGSYAAVTITDEQANGAYHFEAEVENTSSNGGSCGIWGRTVSVENDIPRLYYCYAGRNDETKSWEIRFENPESTWYTTPGSSMRGAFFFGSKSDIRAGRIKPLTMDDLEFCNDLDADYFEDDNYTVPANMLRVECTGFNTKAIRYTTGGETYYIDVVTELPEIGFYHGSTPSQDSYIYDQSPFTVTESDRVFYLLPDDPKNIRNISIVEWYDEGVEDLFEVSVEGNGSAVKFTVKDGAIVPNDAVGVEIQYEVKRGSGSWETRSRSVWVWLENGQPALMFCHLRWDNNEQVFYEPENRRLQTSLDVFTGNSYVVQFYYGTKKSMVKVEPEELTFPAGIIRGYLQDGALWLDAVGFNESGFITYAGENGNTGSMRVNVNQPPYALYDGMTASKTTYLGDEITLGGNDHPEVYLIAASGQTISQIGEIRNIDTGEDATGKFKVQLAGDGSYAILRLNENDLPAGSTRYEIRIPNNDFGDFFRISFMLNRGDLEQLATPTNLVWHKQYSQWYDQEEKKMNLITEDRMGSMGFEVHGLCQNRAEIEIYSSADGYTFPVSEGSWRFGDLEDRTHFSVTDFIYDDLPSGTYKFRVRAKGDGTKYRDSEWSEWSSEFIYKKPTSQLTAPDAADLNWKKAEDGHYNATWPLKAGQQEGAGYFEVRFYQTNENGEKWSNSGIFDIHVNDSRDRDFYDVWIPDEVLEEHGAVDYYFKVRVIPADITQYCISEWSEFSPALDIRSITEIVNDQLKDLLPDENETTTVQEVQDALVDQTAELRAAMAADLELSGGVSSGTLELIQQLENETEDNVEQKVDVSNSAPQQIHEIAEGITMIGATLNLADKNPETGTTPTVTLELDKPKEGIVIDGQQHNAVQFSMKLNGAIDKDDKEQSGQQLIVPVVIDMPVPAGINPDFLVVLHKLWDGTIEQIRPYIYWNESSRCWHARFVIDSFSDFALVEYNFRFEADSVTKVLGAAPFTLAAIGNAVGSSVVYSSSDSDIASVDGATGEVTIHKAGTVIITASASATDVYPKAECSYTLTVTEAPAPSGFPVSSTIMEDNTMLNFFVDVPADAYYYDAVLWAAEEGITGGVDAAHFAPNAPCTRAQAVTFLWRAAGCPAPKSSEMPFKDVAKGSYYYDAVLWAVENGITKGTSDTTFTPNAKCTRAQIVTFLWRSQKSPASGSVNPFADVAADAYYADAVLWAVKEDITNGMSSTTFSPDATCTRAQIVSFLWRALAE